jgi:hypothetical protein
MILGVTEAAACHVITYRGRPSLFAASEKIIAPPNKRSRGAKPIRPEARRGLFGDSEHAQAQETTGILRVVSPMVV